MRILVVYGSKRGGTEGIAAMLAESLGDLGAEVVLRPASDRSRDLDGFDAVVVGGSLYVNRWHRDARRFLGRAARRLTGTPVWLFSSGPLGDEEAAEARAIPPVPQVARLADRVGARGHRTFGGRLDPQAHGFPAAAMARTMAGDWRDPAAIRVWAEEIVAGLASGDR